jgi:hypothetical protein
LRLLCRLPLEELIQTPHDPLLAPLRVREIRANLVEQPDDPLVRRGLSAFRRHFTSFRRPSNLSARRRRALGGSANWRSTLHSARRARTEQGAVAKVINCECGQVVRGESDEELIRNAEQQINLDHPALVGKILRDDLLALAEAALA